MTSIFVASISSTSLLSSSISLSLISPSISVTDGSGPPSILSSMISGSVSVSLALTICALSVKDGATLFATSDPSLTSLSIVEESFFKFSSDGNVTQCSVFISTYSSFSLITIESFFGSSAPLVSVSTLLSVSFLELSLIVEFCKDIESNAEITSSGFSTAASVWAVSDETSAALLC